MAKKKVPDPLRRRHMVERELDPGRALQIAEKRSEEEKTYLKARRIVTEGHTTFQDTQTYLDREQLIIVCGVPKVTKFVTEKS